MIRRALVHGSRDRCVKDHEPRERLGLIGSLIA